jgi:hypothetical protein
MLVEIQLYRPIGRTPVSYTTLEYIAVEIIEYIVIICRKLLLILIIFCAVFLGIFIVINCN